ncbi:major facilitator superfamily domain-containing protein [Mortierella sp. GBAus27b]|nr:major facilitator superfamily domain-containing protein [Mortierella sp. GBAus27b]
MVHDSTSIDERHPLLNYPDGSRNRNSESYTQTTEDHHDYKQSKDQFDDTKCVAEIQALPWIRKPSIYWLLPYMILCTIGAQIGDASQEQLTIQIICKNHIQDRALQFPPLAANGSSPILDLYESDPCNTAAIQALAALVTSRIRVLRSLIVVFTVAYYSSLSDRYGRKVLLLLSIVPLILERGLIIYLARQSTDLVIWILYANTILQGLLGGGVLINSGVMAYVADCTSQGQRSMAFGMIMALTAAGGIVGPAVGGYITKKAGDGIIAMLISIVCLSLMALYTVIIPESRPRSARRVNEEKETDSVNGSSRTKKDESALTKAKGFVLSALNPLLIFLPGGITPTDESRAMPSRYTLTILTIAQGLSMFTEIGVQSIFIPYTNLVFQWTTFEDGIYYSFTGMISLVVCAVIFPGLQKLCRMFIDRKNSENNTPVSFSTSQTIDENLDHVDSRITEEELHSHTESSATTASSTEKDAVSMDLGFMVMGSISGMISYLIVPLFEREETMFVATCFQSLSTVASISHTAIITFYVPDNQIGTALGGYSVLQAMASSSSDLLYGWIFSKTSATVPSAVYSVSAIIALISVLATILGWYIHKRKGSRT